MLYLCGVIKFLIVMANICSTKYVFIGSEENICRFAKDLQMVSDNSSRNEFEQYWCLHLATDLLGEDPNTSKLYVRGEFFLEEVESNRLTLSTSTAGEPCYRLFSLLAEKYQLQHYWLAEETGCRGVWSNDDEHIVWDCEYMVMIEGCDYYFTSHAEAMKFIKQTIAENPDDNVELYRIDFSY